MADGTADAHLCVHTGGEIQTAGGSGDQLDYSLSRLIDGKLQVLSPISSDVSIFKVPEFLRKVNEKAYEPHILAIGPYHRGKNHLNPMEKHKKHYLKILLQRKGEINSTSYVSAMRELETRARANYENSINLGNNEFVEMMLLDACFVVEILRKYTMKNLIDSFDSVLKGGWVLTMTRRDLLLVENQLPFFVLQKFFDMTVMPDEENSLCQLVFNFFDCMIPKPGPVPKNEWYIQHIKHLPGLLHDSWMQLGFAMSEDLDHKYWTLIPSWIHSRFNLCLKADIESATEEYNLTFIRCATELQEAGIRFTKSKSHNSFDIKFKNGRMEIPKLKIDNNSESFFRNLIVYEQFCQDAYSNYVIDYIKFMDCVMNTSKDVELLCQRGIIENGLGDDEVLANMFNRLCDNVTLSRDYCLYSEIFYNVNKHCSQSWNKRIANLRHNYFNSPWALISSFAAVFLLLFTLAQTVFSVLAYIE